MSTLITINIPEKILAFTVSLAALQMVSVPSPERSKEQGEVKFFVNNNKTNK